jgi:hypothetical protein
MTTAEQLAATPDDNIRECLGHLRELSASSESEARMDRIFDDGSALTLTSFNGEEPVVTARAAEEHELEALRIQQEADVAPDA